MWILEVCESAADASYWEAWFAAEYGLPTACFHSVGRNLAMNDAMLARLHASLDTDTRVKRLFDERLLHPEFPHHRPQNGARRQSVNLTMFSDPRSGVGYHRVQWSSNRLDVAAALERGGFAVRASKSASVRYETCRKDYTEALALAKELAAAGDLDIRRRMATGGEVYDLMPISHLRVGQHRARPARATTSSRHGSSPSIVEWYDGPVFDLQVAPTHNYIANGVVVHNSVYRFRGADIRNILQFEEAFPDATTIVLDQNYRSTQTILDAANAVIDNNAGRKKKELWTDQGSGDKITRYHAEDETDEAAWVARTMHTMHETEGRRWSEMAVFYRTNGQSRVDRGSVDAHRRAVQRRRRDALLRPARGQGRDGLPARRRQPGRRGQHQAHPERAQARHRRHQRRPPRRLGRRPTAQPFIEALRRADDAGVSGTANRGIARFLELLDALSEMAATTGPGDLIQEALDRSGYLAELEAENSIESTGRLENLGELVGSAREFASIAEFLEQVSLVADVDEIDDDDSRVVLMTLHSAKGLEFPVVFLVGAEEGVFPHIRALTEPEELEEERRLAYVGITRAREKLFISHAWSRSLFGATNYNPPSRFVEEIPPRAHDLDRRPEDLWQGQLPRPARRLARPQARTLGRRSGRLGGRGPPRAGGGGGDQRRPAGGAGADERPGAGPQARRRRAPQHVRRGRHHRHPRRRRPRRGHRALPRRRHEGAVARLEPAHQAVTWVHARRRRGRDRVGLAPKYTAAR